MVQNEKRTAIYCRVASGAAEDQGAIELQKAVLLAFAEKHGYANPVCYLDDGVGGLTFDRPAFSEMTADIRGGRIAVVIARDISRIGRNVAEVGNWIAWLEGQGVTLVTEADGYQSGAEAPGDFKNILRELTRSFRMRKKGKRAASGLAGAPAMQG